MPDFSKISLAAKDSIAHALGVVGVTAERAR